MQRLPSNGAEQQKDSSVYTLTLYSVQYTHFSFFVDFCHQIVSAVSTFSSMKIHTAHDKNRKWSENSDG